MTETNVKDSEPFVESEAPKIVQRSRAVLDVIVADDKVFFNLPSHTSAPLSALAEAIGELRTRSKMFEDRTSQP